MATATYRVGIIGLGFIGGADQASGDAIGQVVANLDGTHAEALSGHPRSGWSPEQPGCWPA